MMTAHPFSFYISRCFYKSLGLVNSPRAWLNGIGLFILDALTGGKLIIYLVVIASIVDLICGAAVSIKRKHFTRSEFIRSTVEKLLVYGLVLLVFLCIDQVIEAETGFQTDLTAGLVGVIITIAECVSFTASLIILFPNSSFLRLFQKTLTSELARKMNCSEEEVEKLLNSAKKKKPQPRAKNGQFVKEQRVHKTRHKKHKNP